MKLITSVLALLSFFSSSIAFAGSIYNPPASDGVSASDATNIATTVSGTVVSTSTNANDSVSRATNDLQNIAISTSSSLITSLQSGKLSVADGLASSNLASTAKAEADGIILTNALASSASLEQTGWEDCDNIGVSYSPSARTITLTHTGGINLWWRGVRSTFTSPWTSPAHDSTNGVYWLAARTSTNISWSSTPWSFDMGQVAFVAVQPGYAFAARECHGLMPYTVHEELHANIGTYRMNGLTLSQYVLNSDVASNKNPAVDVGVIQDEDLETTITNIANGGPYTIMSVIGSNTTSLVTNQPTFFRPSAQARGIYNLATAGVYATNTAVANTQFLNYYFVHFPVASDALSQSYRTVVLQPQTSYSTLAAAQAEDFRTLALGDISGMAPEFVSYARLTCDTSDGYTATPIKQRLQAIAYLSGSKATQVSVNGVVSTTDTTPFLKTDGSRPMSGRFDVGNNSVTNVSSITISNRTIDANQMATWDIDNTANADGVTTKKSGSVISVANWIPDNLTDLYTQFLVQQGATSRGLLDGPGYLFNDTNGIISRLSTNYTFQSRWYHNIGQSVGGAITNYAVSLSTSNSYGILPHQSSWSKVGSSNQVTVSYWLKLPTDFYMPLNWWMWLFGDTQHDYAPCMDLVFSTADTFPILIFNLGNTQYPFMNALAIPTNVWTHIAFTVDASRIAHGYINGTEWTGTGYYGRTMPMQISSVGMEASSSLYINKTWNSANHGTINASLCAITYIPRGLSQAEISTLAQTLGYVPPALLAEAIIHLPYTESTGSSFTDKVSNAAGTFTGSPTREAIVISSSVALTNSMTVACTNKVLGFTPTSTWMSILAGGVGLTVSDVQGYVSPNNGTNWYQASLSPQSTLDASNTLFQGTASFTNNTTSSNMVLKAVTTSNKVVRILGMWGPSN